MSDIVWTLLGILMSIFIYYYIKMRQKFKYWSDRGVAHIKPLPIFGNALPNILGQVPVFDGGISELYKKFPNEKVVGSYFMTKPSLFIRDPQIIERVFVKDFHHFIDHETLPDHKDSLLSLSLFSLKGNKWRAMRNKLVPTFTTGRIKNMFKQMVVCADNFIENVKSDSLEGIELIKFITSYTTDISSSVIFGIDIKDKLLGEEYKKHLLNTFNISALNFILLLIRNQFPMLGDLLNIRFSNHQSEQFFCGLIAQTFAQRKKTGFSRNDYVQLLLQLKEKGQLEVKQKDPDDDYLKIDEISSTEKIELTDDLLTAQAFQFLTAGFDPMNNGIQYLLFELSLNEGIQTKVRNEIAKSLENHGGYTYTALLDMKYLDQCIKETQRKYPVIAILSRACVKDYILDDNLTIEKGTEIVVSPLGLHHDPTYFPEPEIFNPDRFSTDATIKNFTYLPFGGGPRTCIAMRFAMLEMKLVIAKFLEHFSLELNTKTKIPLEYNKSSIFMCSPGVYFNLTKIK